MKGSWQRWVAAGLLAGVLLLGAGCGTKNEGGSTSASETPIRQKYQPSAKGAASHPGGESMGPSARRDEHTHMSMLRGDIIRQRLMEGPLGEGRRGDPELWLGDGLGTGLAESYEAPQGGGTATGGSGKPAGSGSQKHQP